MEAADEVRLVLILVFGGHHPGLGGLMVQLSGEAGGWQWWSVQRRDHVVSQAAER